MACVYNGSDHNNGDLSHTNMRSCLSVYAVIKGKVKFKTMVAVVDRAIHNHNAAMLEEDVPTDDMFSALHVFPLIVSIDGDIRRFCRHFCSSSVSRSLFPFF